METRELPPDAQAELAHLDNSELADGIAWLQLSDHAQQLRTWSFMVETRDGMKEMSADMHDIKRMLGRKWWHSLASVKTLIAISAGVGGFVAVLLGFAPIG